MPSELAYPTNAKPAIIRTAAAINALRKPIFARTALARSSVIAKPAKAAPSAVPSIAPALAASMGSRYSVRICTAVAARMETAAPPVNSAISATMNRRPRRSGVSVLAVCMVLPRLLLYE